MSDTDILMDTPLRHELAEAGYARLSGADLFERLPSAGWNALARSWDDLGPVAASRFATGGP